MRKKVVIGISTILCIVVIIMVYYIYRMWPMLSSTIRAVELTEEHQSHLVLEGEGDQGNVSTVYMTTEITPEGLMNAYEALGVELTGDHIAVKLSTGEPGSNYLQPDLIQDLVQYVNGTIVECNTAYQGSRTEKMCIRDMIYFYFLLMQFFKEKRVFNKTNHNSFRGK